MVKIAYHASHEQFKPSALLKYVQMAEKAGFTAGSSSDHFHPWSDRQGESGFSWAWLGAAMQATSLPFGVISAPGYRYHPAILAQGAARRFAPYDRFAQFRESEGKSLTALLDEFAQLRARNLDTLAGWRLTEAQLALEGEHPAFGAVSLRQLLSTWVAHDLAHLAQSARVMAKQYRDAVGPWRAYLPVMDR